MRCGASKNTMVRGSRSSAREFFATRTAARRQKPLETESVHRQPAERQRHEHRRRPRHGMHGHSRCQRCLHQQISGV